MSNSRFLIWGGVIVPLAEREKTAEKLVCRAKALILEKIL